MATQPDILDEPLEPQEGEPLDERALDLQAILDAENIADLLSESELTDIGSRCLRGFEIDKNSRKDWLERHKRSLDIAMQVSEPKSFPWPNAANIHYPLLTTAAVQFQARAYPAIVSGSMLVRGRVLGPDPTGEKAARAGRVASHMTWQLLEGMQCWEEETDRLLLQLPIVGCVFRKGYYDEVRRQCMSVVVPAENFVVNYWAKSLESTPRYTQIMPMYPHELREYVKAGIWRDVTLEPEREDQDREDADDDEALGEMLEQHCLIDLDEDGYPEPYIVTLNRGGDVACIRACFDEQGVTMNEAGEVVRIERHQYFVKYGFLPAPDGSFYGIGFGTLLEDISKAVDATINQMLDAGTLQNAQGGFIGSGINIRGGKIAIGPGRWNRVDVTGGTLRDNIVPMDLPGPSAVLFNLLGMLIEAAKGITSVQDVLTGAEEHGNTPATTTLARIEQGMKVMTGIFKRIHRAFGRELKIIRMLNGAHLDDEVYANLHDTPIQVGRADYQMGDLDIVPTSDPSMASDRQKIARAEALMAMKGDPGFNAGEINRRFLEAIGAQEPEKLLTGQQPPDPQVLLEIEKRGDEHIKTLSDIRKNDAGAAEALAGALKELKEAGLLNDAADMPDAILAIAQKILEEVEGDGADGAAELADGPGQPGEMEGAGGDAGVPGLPGPPPGEPDAGMGAGPGIGPGGPAGGLPVQPAPGPQGY